MTREQAGEMYRLRKNFAKFEESDQYIFIRRIAATLGQRNTVKMEDFFIAPYKVYSEKKKYYLDFFASQKAVKVYSIYMEMLAIQNQRVILPSESKKP